MRRLCLLIVFAITPSLHGAIIFSEDFESEPTPPQPPGFIANYRGFALWDVVGVGVDIIGPGPNFPARVDSIMVDLDHTSGSTLITKHSFDLLPGSYTLLFDLSGPVGGTVLDTVVVELGSVFSESITINRGANTQNFVRVFNVASATTGKLSFADLGADSNGAFLDNVQLQGPVVPEPGSIVIWVGLAALLVSGGRRRQYPLTAEACHDR